jgi:putative PEP-CTERM system TPR-repeat lipoprotein
MLNKGTIIMKNNKIKLITLSAALSVVVLSGCTKDLSYDEYMVVAKSQIEQGDASSAIVSLKNAVRLKPKDANSRYELGSLYLSEGDLWSAEKELEKALELGLEVPLLLPKLAKVKMLLSKYDETYEIADNPASYDNEQYVMILTYAGLAAISDNKKDKAEDYISQATMLSADSLYSQVGKAWLNFSDEKYSEVSETLDTILSQSGDFSDALLLSGHLHQAQFEYEKAIEMYSSYVEKHPRQFQIKLYLINSLLSAQKYDEAEKHLELLNRIYQDHALVSLYNAQVEYHNQKFSEAKLSAEKAISNNSSLYLGQLIAGMSAYRLGEFELAYSYLSKVGPLLPANHDIKKLLAMLQFQLGFSDDAQLSFEGMSATTANDMNILTAASRAFAEKGQSDVAENLLEKVVKANPNDNELALQYSALKLANGDKEQIDLLEKLAKNSDEAKDAPLVLATYYVNAKDYENALRVAKEWQSTEAGKIKGQLLEGFIFASSSDIESAKKVFKRVIEQDEHNVSAIYYLGEFDFNEEKWEESKSHFTNILSFEPRHKASVARLSYINAKLGKEDETIEYLNDLLLKYPNNQDIIIDLSINLKSIGKTKEAIRLIEKSTVENKSVRFNRNLAQLYVNDFKFIEAKDLYKSLVDLEPSNSSLWLEYALVDEKMGNIESALTTINKGLNFADVKDGLQLLKANLLLILDRNDSASTLINELFDKYPNNTRVVYLKAQLNLKEGHTSEAGEQFSSLYSANPTNEFALKWAQSSLKNNNTEAAINILENHEQVQSLSSANKALLAELLLEVNSEKSKNLYLELKKDHPNNIAVLNNLAWAYYNLGEFDGGLPYAEQAYNVAKSSATLDTYATLLISNKKESEAIELLTHSDNESLLNESVKLTLIEGYIALNQLTKAKEIFNGFTQIPDDLKEKYNELSEQLN